jgi:hypothetical protein
LPDRQILNDEKESTMIANKEIAQQVSQLMLRCGAELDQSIHLMKDHCRQKEFEDYRLAIGKIMAEMLIGVMNPLMPEEMKSKPSKD